MYYWVRGKTLEEQTNRIEDAKRKGFNAVGHLNPFLDLPREERYFKTYFSRIHDAIEAVRKCRETAGEDMDLCIEIHRRLTPAEAITLAQGIEPYYPLFYEDPTLPDNFDAMGRVAQHINIPIATGERIHTIFEFEMLLARNAVQFVRPDVCLVGGITGAKKIAAIAEAHYVGVVPHNPLGPVSTAACLQIAACIPNFVIQEYPYREEDPATSDIVKNPLKLEDGYLIVPDAPGIGVELSENAGEKHPYRERRVVTRLHRDGSVMDD